jgi:hypothetical protein
VFALPTAISAIVGTLVGSASQAHALESLSGLGDEKAGPLTTSAKLGAAFELDDVPTQFATELEAAYALDEEDRAYAGFALQVGLSEPLSTIGLTASFQYEFPIRSVRGLAIVPRANVGVAFLDPEFGKTLGALTVQPAIGAKWNLTEELHVGLEPIGLPMYFGSFVGVQLRSLAYAGLDF